MESNHQERAAAMLEELEAIERQRATEERDARMQREAEERRAKLSARWAPYRAAAHDALRTLIDTGTDAHLLAAELNVKLEVREVADGIQLFLTDNMLLASVAFEDRPIYTSRYSFRSSGTRTVAHVRRHNGDKKAVFPMKRDNTFSYDKIAASMTESAVVIMRRLLAERRAAATRAGHAPTYRELMAEYGLKPKYGNNEIAHNEWYNSRASAALGRLDVELALQPDNARPFVLRLPSGIPLDAAGARALLDLLSQFSKTTKE